MAANFAKDLIVPLDLIGLAAANFTEVLSRIRIKDFS